jgi:hypothetical protein
MLYTKCLIAVINKDLIGVLKWLQRASVVLSKDELILLIKQIHNTIQSDKGHSYSTSIYNILLPYSPKLVADLILTGREQTFIEIFFKSLIETKSIYLDIFKESVELLRDGYNIEGYDQQGFNRKGFNQQGFRSDGYNIEGYDQKGFNRNGIDRNGFNRDGYNIDGYDKKGFRSDGYNIEGYDQKGFNRNGIDRNGFNRDGYNIDGYDKNGFNSIGVNRNGYISPAKWYEIIDAITHPPRYKNKWSTKEYSELDDQDLALASEWASAEKNDDFTLAKMLSARTAEKIAVKFYQSLGHEVIDVSIKQPVKDANIQSNSNFNDWKLFDLLLDDEISIDVKNARTPLNSKKTYVEHCVSRFKKNRNNRDVIIAGVLSPYLKLDDIQYPQYIRNEAIIEYLGETTNSNFIRLEDRFSKRYLKLSLNTMNFIPRWIFEFPEKFYATRNQQRFILQQVAIEEMPTISLCEKNGVNPLPAYLASGINLPDAWKTDLTDWQMDFYSRIRPHDNSVVTMPVLFLALLVHFLEAVTRNKKWHEYEPELYRQLLYSNLGTDEQMPLGIFDPLETIKSFIETLSILWSNKGHINLNEFELFKFNGVGLLEGKRINKQKYETILAYCGGFIERKGKCGNTPLILGEHESCTSCVKLICNKCGHCSENCQQCEGRMKEWVIDF